MTKSDVLRPAGSVGMTGRIWVISILQHSTGQLQGSNQYDSMTGQVMLMVRSSKKCSLKPKEVFLAVSEESGRMLVWHLRYPLGCE